MTLKLGSTICLKVRLFNIWPLLFMETCTIILVFFLWHFPGDDWTVHLDHLAKLKPLATDPTFQRHFMQVTIVLSLGFREFQVFLFI